MYSNMNYSNSITRMLEDASRVANDYFGKVSSSTKEGDNNQVLTEADISIGKLLVNAVLKEFPTYNCLDEEAGVVDNGSEYTWVIDPIDGTSNFASGVPMYGIYIGLLHNSTPVAGGMSLPTFGKIYTAEKEKGTYCNNERVHVALKKRLLNSLVSYQIDGHQENPDITKKEAVIIGDILLAIRNLRVSNSAFDAAMVIEGKYGALLNQTSKIWDNVAQQILIEEAGGVYTDFFGRSIDYTNPLQRAKQNFTYCAGASLLHQELQNIIHQH